MYFDTLDLLTNSLSGIIENCPPLDKFTVGYVMNIKQKMILRKLVERNGQRYSELYKGFSYDDKFPYHIKALVSKGYVNKRNARYFLTKLGMKQTAYFDRRTLQDNKFKLPVVCFVCNYQNTFFLNDHFQGSPGSDSYYNLPLGIVHFGEKLIDGCNRILTEKWGIQGIVTYRATHHYINYASDGDCIFDDIALVYNVLVSDTPLKPEKWYSIDKLKSLNVHPLVETYIVKNSKDAFSETYFTHDYGFSIEDS